MSDYPSRFPSEPPPPGGGYGSPPPYGYDPTQRQPGYGPPHQPGYGETPAYGYGPPPPGYEPPPPYGSQPVPPPGRNGFAIASLICGIIPCTVLLSVIFGIVALVQIGRNGQRGKGLAIGGLAATGGWVVVGIAAVTIAVINSTPDRDPSGEITEGGQIALEELAAGDCVNELAEEPTAALPAVPCAEPHEGEVFALFDVSQDGDWPGEEVILDEASTGCLDQLAVYSPTAFEDDQVDLLYFYPTEGTWRLGDREVICIAYFLDGQRTGGLPR